MTQGNGDIPDMGIVAEMKLQLHHDGEIVLLTSGEPLPVVLAVGVLESAKMDLLKRAEKRQSSDILIPRFQMGKSQG